MESQRPAGAPSRRQTVRARHSSAEPHVPRPKRRFRIWPWLLALFLLACIAVAALAYKLYQDILSIDDYVVPAQAEPYELKEGSTLLSVVKDLTHGKYYDKELEIWVKLNHFSYPVIQRGKYLVDGTKTLPELLDDMRNGNVVKIKLPSIALIEGMTLNMVMRRLESKNDLINNGDLSRILANSENFMRHLLVNGTDESLLQAVGGAHKSLEGLLMPATYDYTPQKTQAAELVGQAILKMADFMRDNYIMRDNSIDEVVPTPYDVLILASIVERESALPEERPLIAGVFLNRLRKGIRLQTDPTVMYGISPDFKGPLRRSQLQADTPYNTYTRTGLPPTPIAMPSAESILAVLRPATTEAIFFVAKSPDPRDGHAFSRTLKEHNKAVEAYRKSVCEYKANQARLNADKEGAGTSSTTGSHISIK